MRVLATIENVASAMRGRAARRAAAANAHLQSGHRTAAQWLAAQCGSPVGRAAAELETARRLEDLPAAAEAARTGELSAAQAEEVASAGAADPTAEAGLPGAARTGGLQALRSHARRVRAAAAAAADDEATQAPRIHAERALRHWTDRDGAFCASLRTTPESGARPLAALETRREPIFHEGP